MKYSWLTNIEYDYIYEIIKQKELDIFLNLKKIKIEKEYKNKLIKFFCNNNAIELDEFKSIMLKFEMYEINEIEKIFNDADINKDSKLSIDEFIIFLTKNEKLVQKLNSILEYKFELNKNIDKRTLLFNDFPGSPLKYNWRPSLSNLNSFEHIKKNYKKNNKKLHYLNIFI